MKGGSPKERFFDDLAARWDREVPVEETHSVLEDLLAPWRKGFSGARVLDAGCGTGQLAAWLHRLYRPPRLVAALDASRAMLSRLARKVPAARPLLARVEALPFSPKTFDFVLAMGLFPHLEDKAAFLSKCMEVLRPGGWLLILHTAPRQKINLVHRKKGPPVEGDLVPPAPDVVERLVDTGFLPGPWRDDWRGWLVSGKKEGR